MERCTALGSVSGTYNHDCTAIGYNSGARGLRCIAIGTNSHAGTLGRESYFNMGPYGYTQPNFESIAIGHNAVAGTLDSIAIGGYASIPYVMGASTGSNSLCIGHNVSVTTSNTIRLGNGSTSSFQCQVALTVLSDERDKANIAPIDTGLDFVTSLNPVKFNFDSRECYPDGIPDGSKADTTQRVGFLSQDIMECQSNCNVEYLNIVQGPNTVQIRENGNITGNIEQYSVILDHLHPVYVNAFKEMKIMIEDLQGVVANLQSQIDAL